MKKRLLGVFSACALTLGIISTANAAVLTFDDLTPTPTIGLIPDGYGGLIWNNMTITNAPSNSPVSGYVNGLVSGNYVAFNFGASLAIASGSVFDFNGAYLTGAWNDGLNINIKGYNGAALLYDTTVVVDTDAPTWSQFDYFGVNKLEFTSFGGTANPAFIGLGEGTHFAMDNFTFNAAVPIPAAAWLFGSGLIGLVGLARRKKAA